MKKMVSLSLLMSLGLAFISPALNAAAPQVDLAQEGVNLHWEATSGNEAEVKRILAIPGININVRTLYIGNTPLMGAAENGYDAIVQQLIEAGADLNAQNGLGDTALMTAAYYGKDGIVQQLIDVGADVTSKNRDGETAEDIARSRGHDAIVEILQRASSSMVKSAGKR